MSFNDSFDKEYESLKDCKDDQLISELCEKISEGTKYLNDKSWIYGTVGLYCIVVMMTDKSYYAMIKKDDLLDKLLRYRSNNHEETEQDKYNDRLSDILGSTQPGIVYDLKIMRMMWERNKYRNEYIPDMKQLSIDTIFKIRGMDM